MDRQICTHQDASSCSTGATDAADEVCGLHAYWESTQVMCPLTVAHVVSFLFVSRCDASRIYARSRQMCAYSVLMHRRTIIPIMFAVTDH